MFWRNGEMFKKKDSFLHTDIEQAVNSIFLWTNGHHFTDNIFRCIFMNEKFEILIKISLKFVPKGPIGNNPALV